MNADESPTTDSAPLSISTPAKAIDQPPADEPKLADGDRRRHHRFHVARPGKIFRRSTQQYLATTSRDLCFGGALLEIEGERRVEPGEIVDVGLSMSKSAILPSAGLLRGIVVRSQALDGRRQLVAVRYLHRESLEKAA